MKIREKKEWAANFFSLKVPLSKYVYGTWHVELQCREGRGNYPGCLCQALFEVNSR